MQRTVLVTGSGRNIGRAIACAFGRAGCNVVVNGHRDRDAVDRVVAEVRAAGAQAIGVMADVSKHEEVAAMIEQTVSTFGAIDITVSNVSIRRMQAFLDISLDDWHGTLASNLSPAFYIARNAIPHMKSRGWGRIIHISGFDAFWGHVTHRAHSIAAKSGVHGLTKALAREFGAAGITVNTVAPGPIDTERDWSQYAHQPKGQVERDVPVGRYGHVDEIAATCAFVASDGAAYINGQAIHVNGGHSMY
jgi:3-oxoacyl-[acyl-carrier protein] reductase